MNIFQFIAVFLVGNFIAAYFVPAHWLAWMAVGSAAGLAWFIFESWRISR